MKLLFALCLFLTARVLADDVALAKEAFGKYVEYEKTNDPRILDLLTPDCGGEIKFTDGKFSFTAPVPKGELKKGYQAQIEKKEPFTGSYEDAVYTPLPAGVRVTGVIHFEKAGIRGPFAFGYIKDESGAMKIKFAQLPVPMGQTPITSHDLFQFVMPGSWKAKPVGKMVNEGGTLYPGNAEAMYGLLGYSAMENPKKKPADYALENIPGIFVNPLVAKMAENGLKEEGRSFTELSPGNPDQGYFLSSLKGPEYRVWISGIVLRTPMRMYVIHLTCPSAPNVEMWREIAKSFKEL